MDKRSDIWSFGVVVWEMLAGARLFQGETVSHTLADVLRAEIDFTRVPAGPVRDLVRRCLERDVRKRLRDIGEARIAIEGWLADPARLTAAPAVGARTAARAPVAWRVAAVVAALALVALGSATWRHLTEAAPPTAVVSLLPPVGGSFGIGSNSPGFVVSPDGRVVVFRDRVDGQLALWLRELDSLEVRVLPGTEGAGMPFWAPDGRRVAFVADGKLKKLDVAGGPPVTLADAANRGGSWSQDDVILFISPGSSGVSRIPAAGGTPVAVFQIDRSTDELPPALPSFLPDGRHFLYSAQFKDSGKDGVYVGDLESTDRQRRIEGIASAQYVAPGYLLYARGGTLFAQPFDAASRQFSGEPVPLAEEVAAGPFYSSGGNVLAYLQTAGARDQLAWFDRTGRQLGVEGTPGDLQWFSLSPDGTRVVFARRDERSRLFDLWLRDLKRGTESRLTFAGNNNYPVWSPDGAQLYFAKGVEGKVVRISADGSGDEAPVLDGFRVVHPSSDGRYLLSSTGGGSATGSDVWAQPLGSNAKPFPVLQTRFNESAGGLSPDGRWLAYWSDETGRSEVYVRGFPDPVGKSQVSVRGGILPVWSADGRELFYYDGSKMMSVDVQSGRAFTSGQPRELFEVRLSVGNTSFAVARDGRFLLPVVVEENAVRAMTVVLNWQQLLRR